MYKMLNIYIYVYVYIYIYIFVCFIDIAYFHIRMKCVYQKGLSGFHKAFLAETPQLLMCAEKNLFFRNESFWT